MADLEREFPRFIYVPWRDDVAHTDRGDQVVAIAQALAAKTRSVTVAAFSIWSRQTRMAT